MELHVGAGQQYQTIQAAVNVAQAGDIILIHSGTYQERILMARSGTASEYITLKNYSSEKPLIDRPAGMTSPSQGLIEQNGQSHILYDGLKVANSSAYGFNAQSQAITDVIIRNCEIYGHSASGIIFYPGYGIPNPTLTTNILLENNMIYDCQNAWNPIHQADGHAPNETVTISNVDGFTFRNNYLYNNHKLPVDVKNLSRNGQLYGNIIDNFTSLILGNGGIGFYIDSYDDHVMNIDIFSNIVYGNYGGFTLGTEQGGRLTNIRIFNNIYYGIVHPGYDDYRHAFQINNMWHVAGGPCTRTGCTGTFTCMIDENCKGTGEGGVVCQCNVCGRACPASCSGPISNCCENGCQYPYGTMHLKTNIIIVNNTVYNAKVGFKITDRTESFLDQNFTIRNNIFNMDPSISTTCFGTGSGNIDWAVLNIDHNVSNASYSDYWGGVTHPVDPQFMNPQNHDFRLQATSPCINAGNNQGAPSNDFLGHLRDALVDIGAYEYAASYTVDDITQFIINVI